MLTEKALISENSLQGKLLIATPKLTESCFERSVIYVCKHNEEGAMGLIINHPFNQENSSNIFEQLETNIHNISHRPALHLGGPVDVFRGFILHSPEYTQKHTVELDSEVSLTSNMDALADIMQGKGPKKSLVTLGYAGWEAGQLEEEIKDNSWLSIEASPELIFNTDNEHKWQHATQELGFDIMHYSATAGHA